MATGDVSQDRTSELREDFEYLDEDQDGLMEFSEFVHFMDGLGADMSNEECRVGFAEIDSNHDGRIEFNEFLSWWTSS